MVLSHPCLSARDLGLFVVCSWFVRGLIKILLCIVSRNVVGPAVLDDVVC